MMSWTEKTSARLGQLGLSRALLAMLAWNEGRFEFEATVDEGLAERATPMPLGAAVRDAVRALDASGQVQVEAGQEAAFGLDESGAVAKIPVVDATTFQIDFEQLEFSRSVLDKTEDAILELARAGMSVAQFCDVIPEEPDVIRASIMGLVEMGVLIPR